MMRTAQLEEIIQKLNVERRVSFEMLPEEMAAFRGTISLPKENVELKIDFSNHFPLEFPVISILDAQRFYPHVDRQGNLCLFDDSSLLIRTDMPDQMLLDSFDRAIAILSMDPLSEAYRVEVAKEFNAYWIGVSKLSLYTNLSPCIEKEYRHLLNAATH